MSDILENQITNISKNGAITTVTTTVGNFSVQSDLLTEVALSGRLSDEEAAEIFAFFKERCDSYNNGLEIDRQLHGEDNVEKDLALNPLLLVTKVLTPVLGNFNYDLVLIALENINTSDLFSLESLDLTEDEIYEAMEKIIGREILAIVGREYYSIRSFENGSLEYDGYVDPEVEEEENRALYDRLVDECQDEDMATEIIRTLIRYPKR